MLKKLVLENWKSFRYAELPIDPLTVLIGTNASGKSNVLEALEFLGRISRVEEFKSSLLGDSELSSLRGGAEWIAFKPHKQFTLKALIQGEDEYTDYLYSISIETLPKIQLSAESLVKIKTSPAPEHTTELINLVATDDVVSHPITFVNLNKNELGTSFDTTGSDSSYSVLSAVAVTLAFQTSVTVNISLILRALHEIFVLNPDPSKMRSYSSLSDQLLSDASNIAGVLAALPDEEKSYAESTILNYVAHLPERDIQRVWAEPVGRLGSDAMLYCEESWADDEPPMVIDARGMSDGTLRFLAIVTALLTRPKGSQLIIEEVDNGLHPSRAELLLKMLKELGAKRKIDILVTTHNPALLNALQPEMIPFIVAAHRDTQTGESKLTPLDDIQRLPKLLASGHIGDLATQGAIEKSLSQ